MDATALSKEFANSVLPVTIFFGILALFGVLGNMFVLYVYRYKYPSCNFRTFVTCLAATDFVSCLFVFPCEIVGHRMWFSYPKSAMWFCKLKTAVFAIAVMTTSMLLLLISIDRFRKVCRPLGPQITTQNAFSLCLISLVIAVFMTIPIPILFGIQHQNITYQDKNFEITCCEKDDAYKDTIWMTVYLILLYYSPIVAFMSATTLLYTMILKKIFSKNFLRSAYSTPSKQRIIQNAEEICYEELPKPNQTESAYDVQVKKNHEENPIEKAEVEKENSDTTHEDNAHSAQTNHASVDGQKVFSGRLSIEDSQTNSRIPVKESSNRHPPNENEVETVEITGTDIRLNHRRRHSNISNSKHRITRKTIIMFVVTLIFNITMLMYFCALFITIRREHIFEIVDTGTAAIFFLCWRIYFINHVINPVVYGLLDYRFREAFSHKRGEREWFH